MAEAVGLVSGIVGLLDVLANRTALLKLMYENYKQNPSRWLQLSQQYHSIRSIFQGVEAQIADCEERLPLPTFDAFFKELQNMEAILVRAGDDIHKLQIKFCGESPSSSSISAISSHDVFSASRKSGNPIFAKMHQAASVKKITEKLDSLERDLPNLRRSLVNITGFLALLQKEAPKCPYETFRSFFDVQDLSPHFVLDFDSRDSEGEYVTPEGKLKYTLLSSVRSDTQSITVAVGRSRGYKSIIGMGGVGKTVALRALCSDADVLKAFVDGVFFVQLGEDADEVHVVSAISRCVRLSGGKQLAKELAERSSVSDAADGAAVWFEGRNVLFVCDNAWSPKESRTNYVQQLHKILRCAPNSRMMISTRDENMLWSRSEAICFSPREPKGTISRDILLDHAEICNSKDRASVTQSTALHVVLEKCSGLPLALAIAGSSLKSYIAATNDLDYSLRLLADELEEDAATLCSSKLEAYGGLHQVVVKSLQRCQEWARTENPQQSGEHFDMGVLFESLSVLQKQTSVPLSALQRLWDLNTLSQTKLVLRKFVALNLINMVCIDASFENGRREKLLAAQVHDLILDICVLMASRKKRAKHWHSKFLSKYLPSSFATCGSNYEECNFERCREWWSSDIRDDGYIHHNLARHLCQGGMYGELKSLLCDIRWTLRRRDVGDWFALKNHFFIASEECNLNKESSFWVQILMDALNRCWEHIRISANGVGLRLLGYLGNQYSHEKHVSKYLKSIETWCPSPWLRPVTQIFTSTDEREINSLELTRPVRHVHIDCREELITGLCDPWSVQVHDINAKQIVFRSRLPFYQFCFTSLLSADGNRIACCLDSDLGLVWDIHAEREICRFAEGQSVTSVAISADGHRVATGSRDGTVLAWDVSTSRLLGSPLLRHQDEISCLGLSEDGELAVSGSIDGTVTVWSIGCSHIQGNPLLGHKDVVICVAISKNKQFIVSSSKDDTVRVWEAGSNEITFSTAWTHSVRATCVVFSVDSELVAAGSRDGTIYVWNVRDGSAIGHPFLGHERDVTSLVFSMHGQCLVSGSLDSTIRIWEVKFGGSLREMRQAHEGMVYCMQISSNGRWVATGSEDETVRVWDAKTGKTIGPPLRGHQNGVHCLEISADGKIIVSGSYDGTIRAWQFSEKEEKYVELWVREKKVECLVLSNDAQVVAAGTSAGAVHVLKVESGENVCSPIRNHKQGVTCVALSTDIQYVASGSWDKTVCVWDIKNEKAVGEPSRGHENEVYCVAFSASGQIVISGSYDRTLRAWNTTGGAIGKPIYVGDYLREGANLYSLMRSVVQRIDFVGEDKLELESSLDCFNHDDTFLHCWAGNRIFCGPFCIGTVGEISMWVYDPPTRTLVCGEMSGRVHIMKLTCRLIDNHMAVKDSRGPEESEQSTTAELLGLSRV